MRPRTHAKHRPGPHPGHRSLLNHLFEFVGLAAQPVGKLLGLAGPLTQLPRAVLYRREWALGPHRPLRLGPKDRRAAIGTLLGL